jgi:uncharacterized protein YdhG (YjbR/CyaY superfamily)
MHGGPAWAVGGFAMVQKKSAEVGKAEVEAYLARVAEPGRTTLEKMRAMIRTAAPKEATETISYGIPSFKLKGGLVAYAAFKDHCSFFPMGARAIEEFAEELKEFRVSKGTIHFALDKPLPAGLVKKMVKACVARNRRRRVAEART